MKATTGSLKAFDKAKRAKRSITMACSYLMYEEGRSAEDRARIDAFRSSIGGRGIDEFNEDLNDMTRREVEAEATAFLAGYGIQHTLSGWRYTSPPEPGAPLRARELGMVLDETFGYVPRSYSPGR